MRTRTRWLLAICACILWSISANPLHAQDTPSQFLPLIVSQPSSTPTVTPTVTTTPTATPTVTPTATATPTVTIPASTVTILDQVQAPAVKRLGLNLGSHDRWGAAQILKNLIANPGFEDGFYGMVAHAASGSTSARFVQDFWNTAWNNEQWAIGQPTGFWNGAEYELVYGPARGARGSVLNHTHEESRNVFSLSGDATPLDQWDVIFLRKPLSGTLAGAPGRDATLWPDPTTTRPGSPGRQSLRLTFPCQNWQAAYAFFMDSAWRDGDRSSGKLFLVEGDWRLEFWAKGKSAGDRLRARFVREGEANFIDETVTLTTDWQHFVFDVTVAPGVDPPGPYADDAYHPILALLLHVVGAGQEVWIDDLSLHRTDQHNPTAFVDAFVDRLKELRPGVLRNWSNQFGATLESQIAEPWARGTQGWRPHERVADQYSYSLHEFLELCLEVGAEPWYVIPPTWSPEELQGLVEYLAAPADAGHPYADRRAALGRTAPWTDAFAAIHLEFGNELWGAASGGDPFFGASLLGGQRLGAIAHDRFGVMRSSPFFDPSRLKLIIGGQAGYAGRQREIERASSNHDAVALAPYFGILDRWEDDAAIYYPLFAAPFYQAAAGAMRQSKDFIDAESQGTSLGIYEINFHTTSGEAPLAVRNDFVTGLAGGLALPLHMLVYLRELGAREQAAFSALGYSTNFATNDGNEFVRLWGMLRDLHATGRKRPTWLGVEAVNHAIQGDLLTTVQGGDNPSWVQAPFNAVGVTTTVNALQSFAFRDGDAYGLILFNLDLENAMAVTLDLPAASTTPAEQWRLHADDIHADNEDAEAVRLIATTLTDFADGYTLTLPPHSLTVLTWRATASEATKQLRR